MKCLVVWTALEWQYERGATPLYGLYGYVRPQRVWFLAVGHKLGIDFSHFAAILVINRVSIFALQSSIRFFLDETTSSSRPLCLTPATQDR